MLYQDILIIEPHGVKDFRNLMTIVDYIKGGGAVSRNSKSLIFGINRHRAWQIIKDCAESAGLPKLVNPETRKVHWIVPHKLRDAFSVHVVKIDDSGDGLKMTLPRN